MKLSWLLVALIILLSYGYYFFNYGERSIKNGARYGITIGDKKDDVYKMLNPFLFKVKGRGDKVFIRIKVPKSYEDNLLTKEGYGVLVEPLFHEVGENEFTKRNRWVFYINASSLDVIELRFSNERLTEIYRNKKLLELP